MKNALAIIISFVLVSSSFAQEVPNKEDLTHYALNSDVETKKVLPEKDIRENFRKNISADNEKSPVLGGVLSGIIPGAGEFYSKSYVKAAIFLAVEAGLWLGYSIYQNKGNTQTETFRAYADQHWSVRKYAQWLKDKVPGGSGLNPNLADLEQLRRDIIAVEAPRFSHTLPAYGSQQYYELIGKYQSFVPGWEDADISVINYDGGLSDPNWYANYKTSMFIGYSFDRQQANDYYDTSTRFITGVILNHILSAADAVWSVHMFNSNLKVKTGMRVQERFGGVFMEKYSLPMANISVQF